LDSIKGLGKVKKKALLDKFKDLGGIIGATKEQLMQVEGIGEKHAQAILDGLTRENLK
jgi:excinuclease UvrABC nuclease subunit